MQLADKLSWKMRTELKRSSDLIQSTSVSHNNGWLSSEAQDEIKLWAEWFRGSLLSLEKRWTWLLNSWPGNQMDVTLPMPGTNRYWFNRFGQAMQRNVTCWLPVRGTDEGDNQARRFHLSKHGQCVWEAVTGGVRGLKLHAATQPFDSDIKSHVITSLAWNYYSVIEKPMETNGCLEEVNIISVSEKWRQGLYTCILSQGMHVSKLSLIFFFSFFFFFFFVTAWCLGC